VSNQFQPALLLVCSVLVAAGCIPREADEIAIYREVLDAGLDRNKLVDEQAAVDVTGSMALASIGSEALAIEGERYLQSIIDRRRAAATFLPTLALSPSYTWTDDPGSTKRDSKGVNTPVELGMAVNPVRDVAALRASGATIEERYALLLDFQDTLLLDVARTHYEVILAERAVTVLENSLRVQEERVNDAKVRLDAGLIGPLDVSLSEAQAAQTSAGLIEARTLVQTARSMLGYLTAAPMAERPLLDSLKVPSASPDPAVLLAEATTRRQDLEAAARRVHAAGLDVQSAYGQYFPSISLNLQYFLQRGTDPTDLQWATLIQASLPLFSAGVIEADVRTALSRLRQAKLDHARISRSVRRDIEVAVENLRSSFERAERRRVAVRSAGDALEQAEGLYRAGLSTNLERLVAQDRLLTAQLELLNAELDTKVFYLDLRRTTGSLHELIGLERAKMARSDAEAR
jgi:outer membrane protein TolC